MNVWVVTIGEPLPIDGLAVRLYRSGLIVEKLSNAGHKVTWWTSSFNHIEKTTRFKGTRFLSVSDSLRFILLNAPGYTKNISISRFINHWVLACKFKYYAKKEKKPDVILCSFPSIELASQVVKYSNRNNVPVIVDVRDLWPDIFVEFSPPKFKKIVRLILKPLVKLTTNVFHNCDAIIAVSDGYLEWGLAYAMRKKSIQDKVFPLGYLPQLDTSLFKNNNIAPPKFDDSGTLYLNILFIGSFGKTYDLTTAINALRNPSSVSKYKYRLFICGDGERRLEWEKLSEGMDNVIFTGWLNKDEINYYLSIADVGLMAYKQGAPQGLPNKIFEYMSARLPILNSLMGEASNLIMQSNCGVSYTANNVDSFLNALLSFDDSAKRLEMSDNSLRVFEEKYNADLIYDDLISYLNSFVK
jgi:glycosyltransferase involved in cell wall biosynthesis